MLLKDAKAVYVGGVPAKVVYMGSTLVWSALDPATSAYMAATGLSVSYAPALDGLVKGLKTKGLWTKMVAIYPFIGGTAALHRWNLRDPRDLDAAYRLTYVMGTAPGGHSEERGYRPNLPSGGVGVYSGGYADTHFIPRGVLDQDSTHLALYSLVNMSTSDRCDMGCYNWQGTGSRFHIIGYYTSGEYYYGMSEDGITSCPGIGHSTGLFVSTRTAANFQAGYRNGVINGSSNAPSIWLPDRSVYVGSINEYQGRSDLSFGFASVGTGLTAQNNADLYTVVQAFQTALSRAV